MAAGAAATLVATPVLVEARAEAEREVAARDVLPALRIAQRAGLVTVSLAARADGYRFRLLHPDADLGSTPRLRRVTEYSGRDLGQELGLSDCGMNCFDADRFPVAGPVRLVAEVEFVGRRETATFRFPWPMSPDRSAVLEQAVRRTAKIGTVTTQERVTSDPQRGFYLSPRRTLSGRRLVDSYAILGVRDVRQLPGPGQLTRLVYELPRSSAWVEVFIGPSGRIVRDRFVTQNRLWTQTVGVVEPGAGRRR